MRNKSKIDSFEHNIERYESWFDKNYFAYASELKAVKSVLPGGKGIEIGVGTGRFAQPLSIKLGIDPSIHMLKKAKERGVEVIKGVAENLPVDNNSLDFALLTTTICFLDNVEKTFKEIRRILRKNGFIVVAFVDRESFLGEVYEEKKAKSPFYKFANFYSADEVLRKLEKTGFTHPEIKQTLFAFSGNLNSIDKIEEGYGEGGFVIIRMKKKQEV